MDVKDILAFDRKNAENFEKLVNRYSQHRDSIVPFIGAGISAFAYHVWRRALIQIAEDARFQNEEFSLWVSEAGQIRDPHALELAAQKLSDELTEKVFRSYLFECFSPDKLATKEIQQAIPKSTAAILPELFRGPLVTTNFDHVIQEVYARSGIAIMTATPTNHETLRRALNHSTDETYVFMLHGDITETEGMVISAESYNRVYSASSDLKIMLTRIYSEKSMLFLGCSLQVDRTMELLEKTSTVGDQHFAIVACKPGQQDEMYRTLRRRMIWPILYEEGNYDSVPILLNELLKRTNPDAYLRFLDNQNRLNLWMDAIYSYQKNETLYKSLFGSGVFATELLPKAVINENGTSESLSLKEMISSTINSTKKHLYFVGPGGSGKTASMLYLWDCYLKEEQPCLFVPLGRLDTKQYGKRALAEWITQNVLIHFCVNLFDRNDTIYNMFLADIANSEIKSFTLILDGVNEMRQPDILLAMLEPWQTIASVKIIISSRDSDYLQLGNSNDYTHVELERLSYDTIKSFLLKKSIDLSKESLLSIELISLPQMLTLFAGISTVKRRFENACGLDWREHNSTTDIIHNYFECQIAELVYEKQMCPLLHAQVLIRYVLPKLVWAMRIKGGNSIKQEEIRNTITSIIQTVKSDEDNLPLILDEACGYSLEISATSISYLLKQLHFFTKGDKNKYFVIHQNYFDYLVKAYWLIIAEDTIARRCLFENCWIEQIIPSTALEYISNTTGSRGHSDYSIICDFWETLRGRTIRESDLSIHNCLRVFRFINNNNLSVIDFSNMDLSNTSFSGALLSDGTHSASFMKSIISERTFAPTGHHAAIMQVFFLPNDNNHLYAKDLYDNVGVYDLTTDRKIDSFSALNNGLTGDVLYSFSSPEIFAVPDISNSFLGKHINGIKYYNKSDKSVSYVRRPRYNMFSTPCYIPSLKKWLMVVDKQQLVLSGEDRSSQEFLLQFNTKEQHSNWDISADSSTVLLTRICKNEVEDSYTEEVYKINTESLDVICLYEGPILLGRSIRFLSDDGKILLLQRAPGCIEMIQVSDWSTIREFDTSSYGKGPYGSKFLISKDHQWIAAIKPADIEAKSTWYLFIWNVYISGSPMVYVCNDIISSFCFSNDNRSVIIGLFDGSIDEVFLMTGTRHRIANGYRVDLELFNVNGELLVKRSDGSYQKWDYLNGKVQGARTHFAFPGLREYKVSYSGKVWYRLNENGLLDFFDPEKNEKARNEGEVFEIISNEVNEHIICLHYNQNDLDVVTGCIVDLRNGILSISNRVDISISHLGHIRGELKSVCLTEDMNFCIILWENQDDEALRVMKQGKASVLIWNIKDHCIVINQELPEIKTVYVGERCAIHNWGPSVIICFYHSLRAFTIDLRDPIINELKLLSSESGVIILSSRDFSEIRGLSRHKPGTDSLNLPKTMAIAPDGTVFAATDGHYPHEDIDSSFDKVNDSLVMGIHPGDILCSAIVASNAFAVGCYNGILLMFLSEGELCKGKINQTICFNESDYRMYSLCTFHTSSGTIGVVAQKDDTMYAWTKFNCYSMP